MPNSDSSTAIGQRIQDLLNSRAEHAKAISGIDAMLERIDAMLGAATNGRRRGRPPGSKSINKADGRRKRRRGRGSFPVTAEESILAFVKSEKDPTTQEIKKHWTSEGRGGTADNALSKLVKERKLKRTALGEGIRGSRYSLP